MPDPASNYHTDTTTKERRATPLRALLYWKKLTQDERDVLQAMLQIGDSTGFELFPSLPSIARTCRINKRTVQRILHGDARTCPARPLDRGDCPCPRPTTNDQPRNHQNGAIAKRWIALLYNANATRRRAAGYRLQIEAIPTDHAYCEWAINKRWKLPPEIVEELPDHLVMRYSGQQRLPLSSSAELELVHWTEHNPGQWRKLQAELKSGSEARAGGNYSPAALSAFIIATARNAGMPHRLACELTTQMRLGNSHNP